MYGMLEASGQVERPPEKPTPTGGFLKRGGWLHEILDNLIEIPPHWLAGKPTTEVIYATLYKIRWAIPIICTILFVLFASWLHDIEAQRENTFKLVGSKPQGSIYANGIFTCRDNNGKEFEVLISKESELWQTRDQHLGDRIVIKHYGFDRDNMPRTPKAVRYE